jgi:hypothetical protein
MSDMQRHRISSYKTASAARLQNLPCPVQKMRAPEGISLCVPIYKRDRADLADIARRKAVSECCQVVSRSSTRA